ncbi:hypothetical protein L5515_008914 [Caenorhabditis briggsae]|uniref:Uncharacterized protein n=1 Tax=Caenorhabditis briggsae TaxID=6238 RepID=A0AAE9FA60_CAEBR|nr:hypothetical protein L5515_008914 [Caenorhabditis briggsae]
MTGPSNDKDKKIFQRRNQSAPQTENRNRTSAASDIIRRRSNEVAPYRDTPRPSSSTEVGPSQPMDHNEATNEPEPRKETEKEYLEQWGSVVSDDSLKTAPRTPPEETETPRSQTPVTPSTVRENKDFVKSEDQAGPSNRQELHSGRAVSEGISDPLGAVGQQPPEPQVDSPREPIQPVIENNQVIANQPVVQFNHNVPAAPPAQNEQNECLRRIVNACSYCTIM